MPKARKTRGYTDETAAKVKAAFDEIDARGEVVKVSEIACTTRLNVATVRRVLRDALYWTQDRSYAASMDGRQRGLQKGRNIQTAMGHPGLQKARAIQAQSGHPELRKGHMTQAAMDYPGLRKGRVTQADAGYPGLRKGSAKQAMMGYRHLKANAWKGGLANACRTRGRPMPQTHPHVQQGQRTRYRLYVLLANWDDTRDGTRVLRAIGQAIGQTITSAHRQLRHLRADGLLDAQNRIIAPWPVDTTEQRRGE